MEEQEALDSLVEGSAVKGIIFDFDGVIVSLRTDYDSLRKELEDYSLRRVGFMVGYKPLSEGLSVLCEAGRKEDLEGAYEIIERYEIAALDMTLVNSRLVEAIEGCAHSKKLAIFSMNMRNTIELLLRQEGISGCFDLVVARDDVSRYKPNPEGIKKILEELNLDVGETAYVGDREVDEKSGRRAGMKTLICDPASFRWREVKHGDSRFQR